MGSDRCRSASTALSHCSGDTRRSPCFGQAWSSALHVSSPVVPMYTCSAHDSTQPTGLIARPAVAEAIGVRGAGPLAPGAASGAVEAHAGAGDLHLRDAAAAGGRRATKSNSSCTSSPESCILVIELSNGKMLYICSIVTGPGFEIGADAGGVGEREVGLHAEAQPHRGRDQVAERRVAAAGARCASRRGREADEDVEIRHASRALRR